MLNNKRLAWMALASCAWLQAGEIHDAAKNGDLVKVRLLLGQGADPNERDRSGSSPLHLAAVAGRQEVAAALLDAKANLELPDNQRNTPLAAACMRFKPEVAKLLIGRGARVNVRNQWGQAPIHYASGGLGHDLELLELLIAKGADVNVRGRRGEAPLHWAAGTGRLETARILAGAGAGLDPYDSAYGTPLHQALQQGRKEVAGFLIERGADLTEKDPYGYTSLHLAAIRGFTDVAGMLVQRGADVNAGDRYGRTPLYYACRHGRRATADALLAAGAKQDGVTERNFGKPPQLDAPLAPGQAHLWFLGFFAQDGYAVKTAKHLLLFDPPGIDESAEAGLANGCLNPKELEGQSITVFITKPGWERYPMDVFDLANRLPNVEVVMTFKPEGRAGNRTIPRYRLAEPGQTLSLGDVQVRVLRATGGGAAYLVETDGVKTFHTGYHVRNSPDQDEAYRKEIDSIANAAPIDIALVPAAGHVITTETYEAYGYFLGRLSPRAVYLMHYGYGRENLWECATHLQKRGARVEYPENEGDHFAFERTAAGQPAVPRPAERGQVHSRVLGEDREYSVWLPHDYATSQARYPVLFLLDGPRHFEYATGMVEYLSRYARAIQPVIVVDVAQQHRSRDMTPTPNKERPDDTGGAGRFLEFLSQEFVPHIQARYRTKGPLAISGYSLSGLFAIHALLAKPDLFDGYIAASPSLWWDDSLLVRRAAEFFSKNPKLERKLFFAVGKDERQAVQDYYNQMSAILEKSKPAGFEATLRRLDGEGHPTICIPTMYYGLKAVFGQPK
jgi:ankyrin repeat protein/predicted alpha/beta superfamily hydrolase